MKNAKIVRKLFVAVLMFCCITLTISSASAVAIEPKTDTVNYANATLSIKSNLASCSVTVRAKSLQYRITANMTLYRINGTTFTPLKTWSTTGTYTVKATESFYVAYGYDYQVKVNITVKDSSGKLIESFTTNSPVVHY